MQGAQEEAAEHLMVAFLPVRGEHGFEHSTVGPRRKTGSETVGRAPDPPLPELHAHPQVDDVEANIGREMRNIMLGDPRAHVCDPIGDGEIRPAQRRRNQVPESLGDERLDDQSPIRRRVVELAAENDVARNVAASGSMDTGLLQAFELALGVVDPRIFDDVVFEIGQQHGVGKPPGVSGIVLTGMRG